MKYSHSFALSLSYGRFNSYFLQILNRLKKPNEESFVVDNVVRSYKGLPEVFQRSSRGLHLAETGA